jgi:hypothetical protein
MGLITIRGSTVDLRENFSRGFKRVYFARRCSDRDFVHVSTLVVRVGGGFTVDRGGVEYRLNLPALGDCVEVFELDVKQSGVVTRLYRVLGDVINELALDPLTARFTSGFPKVDKAVDEIVEYRALWCKTLCRTCEASATTYRLLLLSRLGSNYALYRRMKEAWLEYSNEYHAYIYALIHSSLGERGFKLSSSSQELLVERCRDACMGESIDWSRLSLDYEGVGGPVLVQFERGLGASKPDILVIHGSRQVVFECKQGPPKTWASKALKQAQKYRKYADTLILVTPRRLQSTEYEALNKHYDYVVDECNYRNTELCRAVISSIVGNVINRVHTQL